MTGNKRKIRRELGTKEVVVIKCPLKLSNRRYCGFYDHLVNKCRCPVGVRYFSKGFKEVKNALLLRKP